MNKTMWAVKKIDKRSIDFALGRRLAATAEMKESCECCGKLIAKIVVMNTGAKVGTECSDVLALLHAYPANIISASDKQVAFWVRETGGGK